MARVGAKYFYAQYLIGYDDYTRILLKITFISLTYLRSRTHTRSILSTEHWNAYSSQLCWCLVVYMLAWNSIFFYFKLPKMLCGIPLHIANIVWCMWRYVSGDVAEFSSSSSSFDFVTLLNRLSFEDAHINILTHLLTHRPIINISFRYVLWVFSV